MLNITIEKLSDIIVGIFFEDNSFHEISQLTIVFGKEIKLIYNSSYKSGFEEGRVEETKIIKVDKKEEINPAILCEDVLLELNNYKEIDSIEDFIKKVERLIRQYNVQQ